MIIFRDPKHPSEPFPGQGPGDPVALPAALKTWAPLTRRMMPSIKSEFSWVADQVPGEKIWKALYFVDSCAESQFDGLVDLLRNGIRPEGPVACFALTGRGFHGQRNRAWSALRGNIHLSLAIPVRQPASEVGIGLTVLPALAALDTVRAALPPGVLSGIKWVNDIWVEGRKLCGVLTQSICSGTTMEYAVLGIGLNVLASPGLTPTPFVPGATRLMDWMKQAPTDPGNGLLASLSWQLLDCVQSRLAQLHRDGQASLVQDYRKASILTGRRICVFSEREDGSDDVPGTLLGRGVMTDIGEGLELLIEGVPDPIARGRAALELDCIRQGWFQFISA